MQARIFPTLVLSLTAAASAQEKIDFARDIQPVFERACASCHGPKAQMGNLRLDAREFGLRTVKAGKAESSELYIRVAGLGDQARMPMGSKPLPPEEIARIKQWIDSGAEWPDAGAPVKAEGAKHWAFVSPKTPAVPETKNAAWAKTPLDRFIQAKLEKEGLQPAPEADRVTLLRRVYLDLIGLPPDIGEVDAFLADRRPDAYERVVDRLLASEHYGEKWARHWLDAARYADSDGFEKDKPREVWFYRDWVIQALNRDMPYNQFIIEQIAGDLLPGATQQQRVATGFLRNSMVNEEGGVDPEQFRMEAMFDRMDAVGKAVLGVTIQCAQCHNHKYDPIKQEDYYRMFAFLNDSSEGSVAVYTPSALQKRAEILQRTKELEEDLRHRTPDWKNRMAAWEADLNKGQTASWRTLELTPDDLSADGMKFLRQKDGSMLAQGYSPAKNRPKFVAKPGVGTVTALRLELLTDANLPLGGPGRSFRGISALSEFEVQLTSAGKTKTVKVASAHADFAQAERPLEPLYEERLNLKRSTGPVAFAIDGKYETAWGLDAGAGRRNQPREAIFVFESPVTLGAEDTLTVHFVQHHGGFTSNDKRANNIGRFRLSATGDTPPAVSLSPMLRTLLAVKPAERSEAQWHELFHFWRPAVAEWKPVNEELERLWSEHPEPESQLVLQTAVEPRETKMLLRGDFLKPGKPVEPGVPEFLHALPTPLPAGEKPNRLTFARWLADPQSPTTARSIVNRIWQTYFGTGIVATSEDFGMQSSTPSHPELLDWLAVKFMDGGWSQKKLHRLIVTSAVYRQASETSDEIRAKDPDNRLLARGPRLRVEAEAVRDIALAASGLLNPKIGGPSIYAPAPEFLFRPPASFSFKPWEEAQGPERYRRALYTFRYRSVPYPMLQTFDAPAGDTACVRRMRSNTPLQALMTLNETVFVEAARALGWKALIEGGANDTDRVRFAFRRVLSREPGADEQQKLLQFLDRRRARLRDGWTSAWELAGLKTTDLAKLPKGTTPVDVGAWTAVARAILNLDEAITKE